MVDIWLNSSGTDPSNLLPAETDEKIKKTPQYLMMIKVLYIMTKSEKMTYTTSVAPSFQAHLVQKEVVR